MRKGSVKFIALGTLLLLVGGFTCCDVTKLPLFGSFFFPLVVTLLALGLALLLSKRIVNFTRERKALSDYPRPRKFDYNLVVIGAGSAGLVSSYIAAAVKAKVALIEKHKMGGDCLNTGCVPSKALIKTAKIVSIAKHASDYGLKSASFEFDFKEVMDRVKSIIEKIEPHDSIERYTGLGVDCFTGDGKILSPYEVEVDGQRLSTKNIIVATGARPLIPKIPGLEQVKYLTSDTIWELSDLPENLVVLGGGPIGCELCQCFQRLGSKVTLIEQLDHIMSREDVEVSELIEEKLRKEGVSVLLKHRATHFELRGDAKVIHCESDGKTHEIEFDEILLALGRKANVSGFGLEEMGIDLADNGTIQADEFLRTKYPNIFVCGDVTGPYQFTHTAAHQAWFASVNALFSPFKRFEIDYRVIPWATFTDPEVARVGLNELEATERNIPYEVTTYPIDDLDRAIADSSDYGFVKVLTPPGKDRILGATIVGEHASDVIVEYIAAMKHGFGMNKILGTIHIYPTLAEANKFAAGNWKKANKPEKVLEWLSLFHSWRRSSGI